MTRSLATYLRLLPIMMILAALTVCQQTHAQTDAQFTQYWAAPTYYNPAATGSTDFLRIRGGGKLQWLGIKNAPRTFFVAADSPLKFGKRTIGLGLNMNQESIGLFSNMFINLQASYKIRIFKGQLSIGVQGGYLNQKFKGSEIFVPGDNDYHDPADEALPTQDLNGNTFDLSAGLYYSRGNWWAGVSGLHLLEPTIKMNMEGSESTEAAEFESVVPRMIYFMGGGNFRIKNTLFELQPSAMVKTDFSTFTAEATLRATYNQLFYVGAGYRYNDAVSIMAGITFKNFFLGYAYDYPLSDISKASSGSHEFIAGYQLKLDFSAKNKNKHRSIRLM